MSDDAEFWREVKEDKQLRHAAKKAEVLAALDDVRAGVRALLEKLLEEVA